jgi:hypothetical protein
VVSFRVAGERDGGRLSLSGISVFGYRVINHVGFFNSGFGYRCQWI